MKKLIYRKNIKYSLGNNDYVNIKLTTKTFLFLIVMLMLGNIYNNYLVNQRQAMILNKVVSIKPNIFNNSPENIVQIKSSLKETLLEKESKFFEVIDNIKKQISNYINTVINDILLDSNMQTINPKFSVLYTIVSDNIVLNILGFTLLFLFFYYYSKIFVFSINKVFKTESQKTLNFLITDNHSYNKNFDLSLFNLFEKHIILEVENTMSFYSIYQIKNFLLNDSSEVNSILLSEEKIFLKNMSNKNFSIFLDRFLKSKYSLEMIKKKHNKHGVLYIGLVLIY